MATSSTPHLDCSIGQLWLPISNYRGTQFDSNASVHQSDDSEGHEVDVSKQYRGVDLSHLRVGKIFITGVKGECVVEVIIVHHVVERNFLHSQCHCSGTHD